MTTPKALCHATVLTSICICANMCSASLVLTNARIYTVDDTSSWAEAIWIDEATGLIQSVGTSEEVLAAAPNSIVKVDMQGRLILPGFQDAHLHAVEAGINSQLCLFDPDAQMDEWQYYFEVDPDFCPTGGPFGDQGWIAGAGIDIGILQETLALDSNAERPIDVLDREFPSTPVFILDSVGHGAIANSQAMQAVGYDLMEGDDPPGGLLDRDPTTGALTGIVLENAQQRFRDAAFPPTPANQETAYQSLLDALKTLNANGITSVSDAGGFWRQAQTEAWSRAEEEGLLTVRASNALYVYPDDEFDTQLPELVSRFSDDPNKLVRFNQAKIYVDGILSLATSALYEPYEASLDLPSDRELGFEYFGDKLEEISTALSNLGFQLHYHVTGDRGAKLALDAIEVSNSTSGPHRLTHLYLVNEQDRARFQDKVIADLQSAPSSIEQEYFDFLGSLIGADRAQNVIPLKELYDAGATITLSSDWDADTLSPVGKVQTVLTRPDDKALDSVETVIPMLTKNVAKLLKTNTGSLEAGKFADLIVLDQDIFTLPVDEIAGTEVLVTVFNGKTVYDPYGLMGNPIGTRATSSAFCNFSGLSATIVFTAIALVSLLRQ